MRAVPTSNLPAVKVTACNVENSDNNKPVFTSLRHYECHDCFPMEY